MHSANNAFIRFIQFLEQHWLFPQTAEQIRPRIQEATCIFLGRSWICKLHNIWMDLREGKKKWQAKKEFTFTRTENNILLRHPLSLIFIFSYARLLGFHPRSRNVGSVVLKVVLRELLSECFGFPCECWFHRLIQILISVYHHSIPTRCWYYS